MKIIESFILKRERRSVETSMLSIIQALVYLPEQDADQIIDRMKQTVKEIREKREVKHNEG